MGAVPFAAVLENVKNFIDTHPDDVVMLIIQDATTPADTAEAITDAGLADRAATLVPGQPLPTLGQLVDTRKTLLVFAEQGGPGAPPWYQKAYDWFQETPYNFASTSDFNCQPNRGPATAPLFLVNHWVNASPPDPSEASAANARDLVESRLEQCAEQRGLVPNVIAVDFAVRAKIAATVDDVAGSLADRAKQGTGGEPTTIPPETTTTTTPPPTTPPATVPSADTIPEASVITTLTGGNPTLFCPAIVAAAPVIGAWAYAAITEPDDEQGAADFVYGPAVERVMTVYVASAPAELAAKAEPLLDREKAATAALRKLGLDDAAIAAMADEVIQLSSMADAPDGITLQNTVYAGLTTRLGKDAVDGAAAAFAETQPDPTAVGDLGYVPNDVALAAGFNCPDVSIG
jgi:hypothetical protein